MGVLGWESVRKMEDMRWCGAGEGGPCPESWGGAFLTPTVEGMAESKADLGQQMEERLEPRPQRGPDRGWLQR